MISFYCIALEKEKRIGMKHIPLIELCARKNNTELLDLLFEGHSNILGLSNALAYIFNHRLDNIEAALLRNLDNIAVKGNFECLELAIIHDKPEILECILKYVSTFSIFEERKQRLRELAKKLNREKCIEQLSKYGPVETAETPDDTSVEYLLEFLSEYPQQLRDELIPLLKMRANTVNILTRSKSDTPYIHNYTKENFPKVDAQKIKVLFDLGSEVGCLCAGDPAVLHHILCQQADPDMVPAINYPRIRKTIELCLCHNPDLQNGNKLVTFSHSIIGLAVSIDQKLNNINCHLIELDYLILDGKMHSFSGHDDDDNFALDFMVPLLIECSVPFIRKELDSIQFASLHAVEYEYLQHRLRNPRTLLRCRDVLRQAFRGEQIHALLAVSNVPNEVKTFIQLEDMLCLVKNIDTDM